MSVSSIGSTAGLSQLQWRSTVRQARQDFEQLFQAMQSGDLSGAQQAYSALQQLRPNDNSTSSGTAGTSTSTDTTASATSTTTSSTTAASSGTVTVAGGTIASDWSALGQALQSGNLSSAQSAFSQLEQDLQTSAQGAGHRHHHHEVDQAQAVYSAMQIANANNATGTGADSTNSIASDIGALKKALQSGDTTSAQNLLTQLQNDLQASGQAQGYGHHHHHRGFALQSPVAAYNDASSTAAATPATGAAGTTSSSTATA